MPKPCKSPPAKPARTDTAAEALHTLIRQIEKARQTLAAWHAGIGTYGQMYTQALVPLGRGRQVG